MSVIFAMTMKGTPRLDLRSGSRDAGSLAGMEEVMITGREPSLTFIIDSQIVIDMKGCLLSANHVEYSHRYQ